jgi:hypothetical protein
LEAVSAYYMKSPPRQMRDSVARDKCQEFIMGTGSAYEPSAATRKVAAAQ